jgi:small multidrug resistance family-3 protein
MLQSLVFFVLSRLCEIGGGYLVWLAVREGRPSALILVGTVLLTVYGFVATQQPATFGRAYAAYGGVFSCCRCFGAGGWMEPCPIAWTG